MNKTYRVVLSDDEQKMLAVVLKRHKLRDIDGMVRHFLRLFFFTDL